jgi:hypothetical protein
MSATEKDQSLSGKHSPALQKFSWSVPLICLGLAAITFAVFAQTRSHDFVNFDDYVYVYSNPTVIHGLTRKGVAWGFTHFHSSNWHPLTWVSHMLDCQIYGLHPADIISPMSSFIPQRSFCFFWFCGR